MKLSTSERIKVGLSVFVFFFAISGILINKLTITDLEEPSSFLDIYISFYASVILGGVGHILVIGILLFTIVEIVKVIKHQVGNVKMYSLIIIALNVVSMGVVIGLYYSIMSSI